MTDIAPVDTSIYNKQDQSSATNDLVKNLQNINNIRKMKNMKDSGLYSEPPSDTMSRLGAGTSYGGDDQ